VGLVKSPRKSLARPPENWYVCIISNKTDASVSI